MEARLRYGQGVADSNVAVAVAASGIDKESVAVSKRKNVRTSLQNNIHHPASMKIKSQVKSRKVITFKEVIATPIPNAPPQPHTPSTPTPTPPPTAHKSLFKPLPSLPKIAIHSSHQHIHTQLHKLSTNAKQRMAIPKKMHWSKHWSARKLSSRRRICGNRSRGVKRVDSMCSSISSVASDSQASTVRVEFVSDSSLYVSDQRNEVSSANKHSSNDDNNRNDNELEESLAYIETSPSSILRDLTLSDRRNETTSSAVYNSKGKCVHVHNLPLDHRVAPGTPTSTSQSTNSTVESTPVEIMQKADEGTASPISEGRAILSKKMIAAANESIQPNHEAASGMDEVSKIPMVFSSDSNSNSNEGCVEAIEPYGEDKMDGSSQQLHAELPEVEEFQSEHKGEECVDHTDKWNDVIETVIDAVRLQRLEISNANSQTNNGGNDDISSYTERLCQKQDVSEEKLVQNGDRLEPFDGGSKTNKESLQNNKSMYDNEGEESSVKDNGSTDGRNDGYTDEQSQLTDEREASDPVEDIPQQSRHPFVECKTEYQRRRCADVASPNDKSSPGRLLKAVRKTKETAPRPFEISLPAKAQQSVDANKVRAKHNQSKVRPHQIPTYISTQHKSRHSSTNEDAQHTEHHFNNDVPGIPSKCDYDRDYGCYGSISDHAKSAMTISGDGLNGHGYGSHCGSRPTKYGRERECPDDELERSDNFQAIQSMLYQPSYYKGMPCTTSAFQPYPEHRTTTLVQYDELERGRYQRKQPRSTNEKKTVRFRLTDADGRKVHSNHRDEYGSDCIGSALELQNEKASHDAFTEHYAYTPEAKEATLYSTNCGDCALEEVESTQQHSTEDLLLQRNGELRDDLKEGE